MIVDVPAATPVTTPVDKSTVAAAVFDEVQAPPEVPFDVNGVVVLQQKISNSPQQVDISRLARGVYMIKTENGGTVLSSKFVKQ